MKQQIVCLSGWGQKFDSLEFIFNEQFFGPIFSGIFSGKNSADKPLQFEVSSLDYAQFSSVEEFFLAAKKAEKPCDILVGWSLGGQLALRLIAQKIFKPKLLILIAPPFQFVKDARIQAAMPLASFKKFRDDFAFAPDKTLKQFAILTAMNDRNASEIARQLDVNDKNFAQLIFWLDELQKFSCFDLDFSNMPQTLYFHGAGDVIVSPMQAQYFKQRIKNFDENIFSQCGHAPQLSHIQVMREIISRKILSSCILSKNI